MNLEDLRAVQAEERSTDSLQGLRDDFYREAAAFIDGRREARDRAAAEADDPFGSEDVRRLTDEIETAEEVVEAIYDRRVGKLVKRASLVAAGLEADEEGLTAEETDLFHDLVDAIEAHRGEVLDAVGGSGRTPTPTAQAADSTDASDRTAPTPEEPHPETATGMDDAAAATPDTPGDDRVTLRVTQDVGEIFGVDERTYDLAAEDVVTLPAPNAQPLLDSDAAERLD